MNSDMDSTTTPSPNWHAKLLLVIASLLIALFLTEIGLRVIGYGEEFPDAAPPKYVRVYDPYRGFYLEPGQTINWGSAGSCFDVRGIEINSFGMRDRERNLAPTGPRITLLGDSFLRAFEVENDKAINRILEDINPGVEFLNFGESGYGSIHSLKTYETFANEFDAPLVIYFMTPSDFFDNHYMLRAWQKNTTGIMEPGWDNHPDFVQQDNAWEFVIPHDQISRPTGILAIKTWLGRNVKFYLLGRNIRDAFLLYRTQSDNMSLNGGEGLRFPAAENINISRNWMHLLVNAPPMNEYWREAWEVTKYTILALANESTANNAEFIVVEIPDIDMLRIDESNFEEVVGDSIPEGFEPHYFYNALNEFFDEHNIRFLNLQAVYELEVTDPLTLYYDCNVHWNERGHNETAYIVSEFIREDIQEVFGQ